MARPRRSVRPGFDAEHCCALLVHGYAIDGLTWAQSDRLATEVATLGAQLVAAPHGDLSATGTPNAESPGETLAFSFVVGAVAARAKVKATQSARGRGARVDEARVDAAKKSFEQHRARLEALLGSADIAPSAEAGLFLLAAGPLASAELKGKAGATVSRAEEVPAEALEVSWDADPDAARVTLHGLFTLSARYD